jgi:AraC-like DNA-binding protein
VPTSRDNATLILTGSTDEVPPQHRLAHWQELINRVHLRVEMTPKAKTAFTASLFGIALGDINLIQVTASAHSGRRRGGAKDAVGLERCLFMAAQRGVLTLRQDRRELVLMPGDLALIDPRLPIEYTAPDRVMFLGVSLPRQALTQRIGSLERVHARAMTGDLPFHQFIVQYLDRLFALAPEIDAAELALLKNHVLDLIAISVGRLRARDGPASDYRTALHQRLRDFVAERLHDPALDLGTVAAQFRVTPSYITRIFREGGQSFSDFLREQRLERCRRMLELSRGGTPSIGAIASSVGFASQAYLNKAFRRRYGMTPGDYRRRFQDGR